jgi:hypothetical protein
MVASSQPPVPDNMGGGLRQLVEALVNAAAAPSAVSAAALLELRVLRDDQSRVLVNVWLDGKHPLPAVHQSLTSLGANDGFGLIDAFAAYLKLTGVAASDR